jgi:hypothetical protein
MKLLKRSAIEAGTCNFCSRQIDAHGVVPGATVFVLDSEMNGGISVRFCSECLAWLAVNAVFAMRNSAERGEEPVKEPT